MVGVVIFERVWDAHTNFGEDLASTRRLLSRDCSINAAAPAKPLKGLATVTNATNPRKTIVKAVITLSLWTVP
jgi:hypothetical protein